MNKQRNIGELRDHLFDAIEKLKNGTMEVKTAQTIAQLGDVVVQSAKVEVDYLKVSGELHSGFIGLNTAPEPMPAQLDVHHPQPELQPERIDQRYGKVGDKYFGSVENQRGQRKLVEIPWRSLKQTLGALECVPVYPTREELEQHLMHN